MSNSSHYTQFSICLRSLSYCMHYSFILLCVFYIANYVWSDKHMPTWIMKHYLTQFLHWHFWRLETFSTYTTDEIPRYTSPAQQIRPEVFYGDRLHRNRLTSEQRRHQRTKRCSSTRLVQRHHLVMPVRPLASVISDDSLPQWNTWRMSAISTPMPNATVDTTTRIVESVFLNSVIVVCCRSSDRCAW